MPKNITQINVFVASPGDVIEERNAFDEVLDEVNTVLGPIHSCTLNLKKWETDTHPSFGEDAQDVINRQINDDYDIFIGIMWVRFGTPTNRAKSGTKEEFERAYEKYKQGQLIDLMFYFKNTPIEPNSIYGV
jgi:hypothetical protein